ncbi:Cof-type HAD-IIB family hydrolase [Demequina capsici]|uniref:Cof-type HAD-IIB family hydrolase n=1 Tax=Demequina capsici TaxID=3075620 RepID=A0AA96FFX3_9MICO|nr:Cof-type HAD-IIB family hydrolase [Demequina sp. PMTSA13]WNM28732.1 Cof-type HAD-IIB family hydrolase [Demequina sp. PMTSA13]
MDGTLLDEHKQIPARLWGLLDELHRRGIAFAPASGRQYATLAAQFGAAGASLDYIAENGAYVVREGREVSASALPDGTVPTLIDALRSRSRAGADIGVVLCGKRSAYVERTDGPFLEKVEHYYKALEVLTDLHDAEDDFLKIAVYDFGGAEGTAESLAPFGADLRVVVSDHHWVDVMAPGVDKGRALAALQRASAVSRAQTAVFGDFLNDLEMMAHADLSFAMANAHPDVAAAARYRAPSNAEQGVITVLEELLRRLS